MRSWFVTLVLFSLLSVTSLAIAQSRQETRLGNRESAWPRGGTGGSGGVGLVVVGGAALLFLALSQGSGDSRRPVGGSRGWTRVDLSAVRVALEPRARARIEAALDRSEAGGGRARSRRLREVVRALEREEDSWRLAEVRNYHPMSAASAQGIFRQLAQELRPSTARTPERDGELVVLSLIVASSTELLDVDDPSDPAALRALLDDMALGGGPESVVAMEAFWEPVDPDASLTVEELERRYPKMRRLAEGDRVACSACEALRPAGPGACPRCGSSVEGAPS